MLRLLRNKKAQNTAEYAILIALIIGVFSAMQIYVRRGMQARIKSGADNIPQMVIGQTEGGVSGDLFGNATQYEPYYVREGEYSMTSTTKEGTEKGIITNDGGQRDLVDATSQRTGRQGIGGAKEDPLP